jgi:hypothetical protein
MQICFVMTSEIIAEIIGSSVTLIGIAGSVYLSYKTLNESKKLSRETKVEISINNLKEKRNYISQKLNEFYYPLRNYLNVSKSFSEILKSGKPAEFRTLLYLLNPDQEYKDQGKIILSDNDKAILKQIFKIGFEIEKLISEKSVIIDDPEFISRYEPNPGFDDVVISEDMPILTLAQNHLSIIRLAFEGGLKHEEEKYRSYVYPRELNKRVDDKIAELLKKISEYNEEIRKLIS